MFQQFKHKFVKLIGVAMVLVIFISACNIPTEQVSDPDELVEKALQTLQWQQTQQSIETMVSQLTQVSQATDEAEALPTQTPIIQVVTATPNPPTQTPYVQVVTATPMPATSTPNIPTATPIPCNQASFVKDVSIPDWTELTPGTSFTKTWRIKNTGSCTWTTAYDLVFTNGNAMNAPAYVPLAGSVAPGQTIDISVNMKAPEASGDYSGFWMLRNQNDALFGVSADGLTSLWVKIKVSKVYAMAYNFAEKACDAAWSTPNGSLACPGNESSVSTGYVVKKTDAKREDGVTENELSLVTRPNAANDGVIFGIYPAFKVQDGDQFRSIVNCEYNSAGCNVTFKLKYQVGGGDFVELASWHEVYEGKFNDVVVNLSTLAGKDVKFLLYVKNNNTATNNKALWVLPSIWRLSSVVAPTVTPVSPTPTALPSTCNLAKFVKDVTIPDGTVLGAGQTFTKTWRIQNVGSCTWTTAYDWVFVSGNAMNAPAVVPLTQNVAPGQTVDISVTMKSPNVSGDYTGYWMLRNQYDARFGSGVNGTVSFWVKIKVKTYAMVYNFADKACDADWGTPLGALACPGDETSVASGYVVKKTDAKREDGVTENELSLVTRPNAANDGVITGIYPAFQVKSGDQFRAVVNCEYNSAGCDVTFRLKYQVDGGEYIIFDSWHEVYEGKFKVVNIDLSSLAGKNVIFVLQVKNNNTAVNNKALWILPSIWR